MPEVEAHDERFALVPTVNSSKNWKPVELDPFELRTRFLKLNIDNQQQTIDFLNDIGVWNINEQYGEDFMRIERPVGHRYVSGYAAPFTVGVLKREQERALQLMDLLQKHRDRLRDWFGPPTNELAHAAKNRVLNTLPMHIEWSGGRIVSAARSALGVLPQAVIQPVTGHEMLTVTLHLDLVRGAKVQVCEKCQVRFTGTTRYCGERCRRNAAQKAYRERKAEEKAKHGKGWRKTI
jgi:hypothetical protein